MQSLDISTSLSPIINLTGVSTSVAIARASTCKRVTITIDNIPDSTPISIPVHIIDGMEYIMERGTVRCSQQSVLISKLFELMRSSPLLSA